MLKMKGVWSCQEIEISFYKKTSIQTETLVLVVMKRDCSGPRSAISDVTQVLEIRKSHLGLEYNNFLSLN